ncbi:uncharacterized protein LOC103520483 [Diaphorina citri]|uniref:Uncharacterized protein LOC103520483 n=1 Tax=Diaphorina citri TaxID=121845 RepID=A0A1S3DKZ9_DIACI|nr:uncharacterized protein LOC103520483 [Diaphorina citri]
MKAAAGNDRMVSVLCQHIYKVLIIVVLALVLIEFTFSLLSETHNFYMHPFLTSINYTSPFMSSSIMYFNLTVQVIPSYNYNSKLSSRVYKTKSTPIFIKPKTE